MKTRSLRRIYALETKTEFLRLLRSPTFVMATIGFPLMFYLIFGLTFATQFAGGLNVLTYTLATYGTFGVIGVSLFAFGVGISNERRSGWLRIKRASPMPPEAFFVGKICVAFLYNALTVALLFSVAFLFAGVRMPATEWASLGATLISAVIPFSTLGFAFGYLASAQSSSAFANLFHLPMGFASGLWIPLHQLPQWIQDIAPFLPYYHFAQLALKCINGSSGDSPWLHIGVVAGYTALFFGLALMGYKRSRIDYE